MKAGDLFSTVDRERVRLAVHEAEMLTSGEIRVYIEDKCNDEVLDRAAFIFGELKMHETEFRNGTMIYLAVDSKKFAIIGDVGIHVFAGDHFWDEVKSGMQEFFKQGNVVDAILHGVKETGKLLQKHFPRVDNDTNELSDDMVFGGEG